MSVNVSLTLPIEEGETGAEAVARVDEIVLAQLLDKLDFMNKNGKGIIEYTAEEE